MITKVLIGLCFLFPVAALADRYPIDTDDGVFIVHAREKSLIHSTYVSLTDTQGDPYFNPRAGDIVFLENVVIEPPSYQRPVYWNIGVFLSEYDSTVAYRIYLMLLEILRSEYLDYLDILRERVSGHAFLLNQHLGGFLLNLQRGSQEIDETTRRVALIDQAIAMEPEIILPEARRSLLSGITWQNPSNGECSGERPPCMNQDQQY